jgi:hypothetical protein
MFQDIWNWVDANLAAGLLLKLATAHDGRRITGYGGLSCAALPNDCTGGAFAFLALGATGG